ncbi:MAG: type toxin-antitoxin system PemK/MazF family toxin [Marmoricola sp.]|nr:type toxin-antitoxin system PemK/MazF family toxin [Marmoricola sp.]
MSPRPHRPSGRPPYSPAVDGRPSPGEIVWTWVPFSDGGREGKDRPVLVVALDGSRITALPLTSGEGDQRRSSGAWFDLGDWQGAGRDSRVQLDRALVISVYDVRRNGHELAPGLLDQVLRAARRYL